MMLNMDVRLIYKKYISPIIKSMAILVALTMDMSLLPYNAIDNDNVLVRFIVTIIMSFNGFHIVTLLAFPILVFLCRKAFYFERREKQWMCRIPAVLFALFMVVGYTFHMENSYYLLFGDWDLGQTAKTVLQLAGYYNLFYLGIYFLYDWLEHTAKWNFKECSSKYSFLIPFLLLFLCWMPYLIACFPGYVQGDTPDQIRQIYGIQDSTSSYLNLLSENVTLNNHHPVLHTLIAGGIFRIGHMLGSDNLGVFLYVIIQYTLVCITLAASIAYLGKLGLPYWVRSCIFAFYLFVPVYMNFAILTTKDVFYAVALMWYTHFIADLVLKKEHLCKNKKGWLRFFIICLFCVFFRHNGIYVILLSLPFVCILEKKYFKFVVSIIVSVLCVVLLVNHVVYPALCITSGSVREALSVPMQQTARYIYEYEEDLTQEEREIIGKVMDIDACRNNYTPRLADPVKATFHEETSTKELIDYFKVWFKMFFKHPGCYMEAFINNTYGYFYFGDMAVWKYDETESENVQSLINPAGFNIHHIESLHSLSTFMDQYIKLFNHLPVISIFDSCAFYTWGIVILCIVLWDADKKKMVLLLPALVSLLVCFAGPLNGIDDFRYMFPIAFILPFMAGVEMKLVYCKEKVQA